MQLTCLSWMAHRPCFLLRWDNTTIMVDCALDTTSFSNFLPFFYTLSPRLANASNNEFVECGLPYLKTIRGRVYVESVPELYPASSSVEMENVDAIVISNWTSLAALPYYTEGTGFRGKIFTTEPTLQFGSLIMEEMLEYFERININPVDDRWKEPDVYHMFPNFPTNSPRGWRPCYDRQTMDASLARITTITFRETVEVEGVSLSCFGSGFSIGSANWLIHTPQEKVAYLASTSSRVSHAKAVDFEKLRDADCLLLTSLCRVIDNQPEQSAVSLVTAVVETVKKGGNVILPVIPYGVIYDLIEHIARQMDAGMDVPIYIVSPVARRALSFANAYAEYLSENRQSKVYLPEDPFLHLKLIKSNAVKIYDNLYEEFSQEMRTPCVVFTGHPSLRIGDAPHLIEMWGNDTRSCVILSDPDFPPDEVYAPFEDLPIRLLYYPIDTRLDYAQLNETVLADLSPKTLIVPDAYMKPLSGRANTTVEYNPMTGIRFEESLRVSRMATRQRIKVHPDVLKHVKAKGQKGVGDFGICSIRGHLSCYDNHYELNPVPKGSIPVRPKYTGKISQEALSYAFQKAGLAAKWTKSLDGRITFKVDKLDTTVTLSKDCLRTQIRAPKEHRPKIVDIVTSCLSFL